MPSSRRPDSTETSACPPSWAIVITLPASRQVRVSSTMTRAARPATATTQAGGAGWTLAIRSQTLVSTFMAISPGSWRWQPGHVAGQQRVADEGHRVDQRVRDDQRRHPAPPAVEVAEDDAHGGVADEPARALVEVVGAADHRADGDRPGRLDAELVQPAHQVADDDDLFEGGVLR